MEGSPLHSQRDEGHMLAMGSRGGQQWASCGSGGCSFIAMKSFAIKAHASRQGFHILVCLIHMCIFKRMLNVEVEFDM